MSIVKLLALGRRRSIAKELLAEKNILSLQLFFVRHLHVDHLLESVASYVFVLVKEARREVCEFVG